MCDIYNDKILFVAPTENIKTIFNDVLNKPRIRELIEAGGIPGCWPGSYGANNLINYCTINTEMITHLVKSYRWDGLILKGDIELIKNVRFYDYLKTPMDSGGKTVLFIPRMIGKRDENGVLTNIDRIIAFDISPFPSHEKFDDNYYPDLCKKICGLFQYIHYEYQFEGMSDTVNKNRQIRTKSEDDGADVTPVKTNEDIMKELTGVELACFIYMAQVNDCIMTPVQWSEWLLKPTTYEKNSEHVVS